MAPNPLPYRFSVNEPRPGIQLGNRNQARGERTINMPLTTSTTPTATTVSQPTICISEQPAIPLNKSYTVDAPILKERWQRSGLSHVGVISPLHSLTSGQ